MSTERDELAEVVCEALEKGPGIYDTSWREDCAMADIILAAGYRKPRTVTTVEELAALPNAAVIRDRARDVAEKRGGLWCQYETSDMTDKQMAKFLPATVLEEAK